MNLPENYVVICNTQEETNEVFHSLQRHENYNFNYWKYVCISKNRDNVYSYNDYLTQWFKNQNISEYKTFTFKEWKEMKENKFPEKWAILATEENFKEISDFYVKHTDNDSTYKGNFWLNKYFHSHNSMGNKINQMTEIGFSFVEKYVKKGFEIISFEQFKEHVLNQKSNKTMQKLIINANELLEIHNIACSSWKTKLISYLQRLDNNQMISFNQQEVDEMFDAATSDQKPVLERIFGKQVKLIEWDKIKTGSKVILNQDISQIIGGNNNVDYSKPFDVVFWKTPHSIDCNNEFKSKFLYDFVSTFYQNKKYIRFDAGVHTDYIKEVIEY